MGGITVAAMEWWSIEVFNGRSSAARWKDAHGEALVEAALTNGAVDWAWQEHRWGVVLEVAFLDEWRWERFYGLPAVQAALDAAPDPVKGLLVHRGRGGSSGSRLPRRPRPLAGAGAVELPEPDPDPIGGGTLGAVLHRAGVLWRPTRARPASGAVGRTCRHRSVLAVAGPAAADQSACRDFADGRSGGKGVVRWWGRSGSGSWCGSPPSWRW